MKYKLIKNDNYNLHIIKTKKFKTIEIDIKFYQIAKKDELTKRSLIPYILRAGSKNYQSKKIINERLEELYGASLYVSSSKQGLGSFMNFSYRIVNEKYLDDNLLDKSLEFLNEIIFNPLIIDGGFNKDILDEEKRLLVDEINSIKDNKGRYAYLKMLENMYPDDIYSLMSLGVLEEIDNISSKDLYDYYKNSINNDIVDIIISGDVDDSILDKINRIFKFKNKLSKKNIIDYSDNENVKVKEIKEYMDISQAKLVIGYRTYIRNKDELHYPMILCSAILGGYSHSKLFMNVREKSSLAYSIYSKHDSLKGLLAIQAGIDTNKYEEAIKIINEQIDDMKKGHITDDEINMTKMALINDFLESLDSQASINQKAYNDLMLEREFSVSNVIDLVNNVTKDEIVKCANKIVLDTIYFLGSDRKC